MEAIKTINAADLEKSVVAQKQAATHQTGQKKRKVDAEGVNVMALAYYYLCQAATTRTESALVQAKQLKANGLAQQELDHQEAGLKWQDIPSAIVHRHLEGRHKHTTTYNIGNGKNPDWRHKTWYTGGKWVTTCANQAQLDQVQAQNNEVEAQRQFLTQKMGVLQQEASIGETHVNTISNEATQSMQEGASFLQILQGLTFKALMTRQP